MAKSVAKTSSSIVLLIGMAGLLCIANAQVQSAAQAPKELPAWPPSPLPSIKTIPSNHKIVIEVRAYVNRADSMNEIALYDLTEDTERLWNVAPLAVREAPPPGKTRQAGWAPGARKLFYATSASLHLISLDGSDETLTLKMPGGLQAPRGMTSYAVSPDGTRLMYLLVVRDPTDRQEDRAGRLYNAVMVQPVTGELPVAMWSDEGYRSVHSWSPNGELVARTDSDGNLMVSDLQGQSRNLTQQAKAPSGLNIGSDVTDVRWSPDGRKIGYIQGGQHLTIVNPDGTDSKVVEFRNGHGPSLAVRAFSWSPDSSRFVFRAEGASQCDRSAVGYKIETGEFPCTISFDVFTAKTDGTDVKKISHHSDPFFGELFWIQ
jgi:Tol biopolymer transport system component